LCLILDYGSCFCACSPPFSSLLFLFFLPSLHSLCNHVWLHKYHSWRMAGYGSTGKFNFLSLLVKQLGPWIVCVFRGDYKVYRTNKALKQIRFAFGACRVFLEETVRYPIWTCSDPISLILWTRFSLILGTRFSILGTRIGSLSTGIVGLQHAVAHMCQTGSARVKCGPPRLFIWPAKLIF